MGGGARKWVDGRKCVWVISVWEEGAYGGRGVYGGRGSVWKNYKIGLEVKCVGEEGCHGGGVSGRLSGRRLLASG